MRAKLTDKQLAVYRAIEDGAKGYAGIHDRTGFTKNGISSIVRHLVMKGVIQIVGKGEWAPRDPSIPLDLDPADVQLVDTKSLSGDQIAAILRSWDNGEARRVIASRMRLPKTLVNQVIYESMERAGTYRGYEQRLDRQETAH